jgi:hypothetical protein
MSEIGSRHCVIHRHALVAGRIPLDLQNILSEAVKTMNFIKSILMKSRIFTALCEEMGSEFKTVASYRSKMVV